jgi:hypothetical protein
MKNIGRISDRNLDCQIRVITEGLIYDGKKVERMRFVGLQIGK